MLESKIVAYDERINILINEGVPFVTYWFDGILYFAFPDELSYSIAHELFGFY